MARQCSCCAHPERTAIDRAIAAGAARRGLAREYGLGEAAIRRHQAHLAAPAEGAEIPHVTDAPRRPPEPPVSEVPDLPPGPVRIVTRTWSTYTDRSTGAQFRPVLDHREGIFVGVATVTADQARVLLERSGFQLLDDREWLAMGRRAPAGPQRPFDGAPVTPDQAPRGSILRPATARHKSSAGRWEPPATPTNEEHR